MTDEPRDARPRPTHAPRNASAAISASEFAGVGVQFAAVILVFVFAGVWLDKRLGTSPWFVLIGVFVGATAGFYSMYSKIMAAQRRDAERKAAEDRERRR
jgi:F0F1-type ATP synthase assembly protein I